MLFSIFGCSVTPYALCVALSALLSVTLFLVQGRKLARDAAWVTALLALPLGLIGARLFWCLVRFNYLSEVGLEGLLSVWNGGYAIWGAFGGATLACLLAAKLTRVRPALILDAMAPAGALMVSLCRFAEYFSGEGIGDYVENEALCFFPLALLDTEWEEWHYAIFMAEGLVALAILVILLCRRTAVPGNRARLFMILYCSAQVILESLRRDNFLRWLFVRVSQVTAVVVMLAMMLAAIRQIWRGTDRKKWVWTNLTVFILCVGACIALEFAFDKSAFLSNDVGYLLMLGCCVGLGVSCGNLVLKRPKDRCADGLAVS